MSAWAVWNIVGLYPANPAGGHYMIGSPMVDRARIQLKDNKILDIEVLNNSSANTYVQSVRWNGSNHKKVYFHHKDILAGGKITIQMGPQPNENWGADASWLPPALNSQASQKAARTDADKTGFFQRVSEFFNNLFN